MPARCLAFWLQLADFLDRIQKSWTAQWAGSLYWHKRDAS
jgi:hypothetical protein